MAGPSAPFHEKLSHDARAFVFEHPTPHCDGRASAVAPHGQGTRPHGAQGPPDLRRAGPVVRAESGSSRNLPVLPALDAALALCVRGVQPLATRQEPRGRVHARGAEDDTGDACVEQRADTHGARLQRHVEHGPRQPPAPARRRGGPHRQNLGVGGRVAGRLGAVVGAGDHAAVAHDYGPDGHLPQRGCTPRLRERVPHEGRVGGPGVERSALAEGLRDD